MTANNNVISAASNNNDNKSHVTPVKVFPPTQPQQHQQLDDGDAVTSTNRREVAVPGVLEVKAFNHVQPVYYNQAQCVPLYGQYPGQ